MLPVWAHPEFPLWLRCPVNLVARSATPLRRRWVDGIFWFRMRCELQNQLAGHSEDLDLLCVISVEYPTSQRLPLIDESVLKGLLKRTRLGLLLLLQS